MEKQPEFNVDLFPRITRVAEGIKKIWNLGRVVEPCLAEHQPTYKQLQLELEDTNGKLAQ